MGEKLMNPLCFPGILVLDLSLTFVSLINFDVVHGPFGE
jgi:hypothetical protein